ncbi:MAG: hypothetical protein GX643_17675 [Acidimicrobiales bacterium]|nr:hypothetical protein [Acidimicrobiales bacterium]
MSDSSHEPQPFDAEPPPDAQRRLWIIAAILAVIAVIAVALLFTTILDEDDDDPVATTDSSLVESTTTSTSSTSTTSTTTSTTTTTSEPEEESTTTAPDTTTTTSEPPITADPAQCRDAGADPTYPDSAAQAVFIAWTRGDTACARELMDDEAFDQLFSKSGAEATDDFQGCWETDEVGPNSDCAFTYEGGSTHYVMRFSPTDGWQVSEIYQVAD